MVFVESSETKIIDVSYELISKARILADELETTVAAVLVGQKSEGNEEELFSYGANKIYTCWSDELMRYRTESYCSVMEKVIAEEAPEIVLFGATKNGRDLAPRLASKLSVGLTADCTWLDIDLENRLLLQTRPAFGGNLMATITCEDTRPQMATVRPGVMNKCRQFDFIKGSVINIDYDCDTVVRTVVTDVNHKHVSVVNLSDADIIVSGGRGLGKPGGFELLQELADALGGVIGSTRAVVDANWIDKKHQVGQTGTNVRPTIYFACGISGAIQHVVGMQDAELIIAINDDPNAPIHKIADYSIVDDLYQIIPKLIQAINQKN